jgi:hypothetical protein
VLNNLTDPKQRQRFAAAASQTSARGRAAALDAVKEKVKDPDERKRLQSLLTTA